MSAIVYAIIGGALLIGIGAIVIGQHLRLNDQWRQLRDDATTIDRLDAALADQTKINRALRRSYHDAQAEITTLRAAIPAHHAATISREENWRNQ
mgnify:CR=1 FL=1